MFHHIIFKCKRMTLKTINGVASQRGVAGENISQHQASTWKEVSNEKGKDITQFIIKLFFAAYPLYYLNIIVIIIDVVIRIIT